MSEWGAQECSKCTGKKKEDLPNLFFWVNIRVSCKQGGVGKAAGGDTYLDRIGLMAEDKCRRRDLDVMMRLALDDLAPS